MNFKSLLLFLLVISSACGVKGPPKAPKGTEVPSFISPYLNDKKVLSKNEQDQQQEKETKEAVK